jgi:hypothetical protein
MMIVQRSKQKGSPSLFHHQKGTHLGYCMRVLIALLKRQGGICYSLGQCVSYVFFAL